MTTGWALGNHGFEIGKDGAARIVVGYDRGDGSLRAAAWAFGLARRENATLIIVFVEPFVTSPYWLQANAADPDEMARQLVQEVREASRDMTNRLDMINWEVRYVRGSAAAVLERVAEEARADCVVVGRSQKPYGIGGVPKALLQNANRPVVVVP